MTLLFCDSAFYVSYKFGLVGVETWVTAITISFVRLISLSGILPLEFFMCSLTFGYCDGVLWFHSFQAKCECTGG